jgi:hypothetical protein
MDAACEDRLQGGAKPKVNAACKRQKFSCVLGAL